MIIRGIIDLDSIVFKAALTNTSVRASNLNLRDRVNDIEASIFADELEIFIKGKGNYRNNIYPDYKANRKGKQLEEGVIERLSAGYEYARENLGAIGHDGLEADDLVCISAHKTLLEEDVTGVVCAIDKDMLQIPGLHFNFDKNVLIDQPEDDADLFYWSQCLIGDGADNVPGIKGLGEKKTAGIMSNSKLGTRHRIVANEYRNHFGPGWEDMLRQYATSLFLLRNLETTWDDWYQSLTKDK